MKTKESLPDYQLTILIEHETICKTTKIASLSMEDIIAYLRKYADDLEIQSK